MSEVIICHLRTEPDCVPYKTNVCCSETDLHSFPKFRATFREFLEKTVKKHRKCNAKLARLFAVCFTCPEDSCLPQIVWTSMHEAPLPRPNPALNEERFWRERLWYMWSHQQLITIVFYWSHERNQPPRTSCSIFCRHINNSSTIHHHRRRRRLHTIDIHGHGVGKSAEYIDCRHDDLEAKTRTLTTAWTWTTKRPTTTTRTRTTKATPTTPC